jgi:hypothetical protein
MAYKNNRLNWIIHVEKIEPERIPKQLIERLMLRWKDPTYLIKERNGSYGPNLDVDDELVHDVSEHIEEF